MIQVVTGPRQVGKTTAVQQILSDLTAPSHYAAADLSAPPGAEWIARQWDLARLKASSRGSCILVLDEVQKVAHWSVEIKRLWDEDVREKRDIKVVILGSSSLLIQQGLDESLAGRFEVIRLPHWSWSEMREYFGMKLDQYIFFGGYPGAARLIGDEKRWSSYVCDSLIETTLSKDILLLHRVEKPAILRQVFVLACEYAAQMLSYQKMLGQLTGVGNTTTIAHYQRLLESAYLIRGLSKWTGSAVSRRSSSPKWLPLNTALVSALAGLSFEDCRNDAAAWGRLVESAVGAHLTNAAAVDGFDIFYWRQGNSEVDFVLRKGQRITAVEVKSGRQVRSVSGLSEFGRLYPRSRKLLVGSDISVEEFLSTPPLKWMDAP